MMNDEKFCEHLKELDFRFGTSPRSPLHHDNRCPIHSDHPHVRDEPRDYGTGDLPPYPGPNAGEHDV